MKKRILLAAVMSFLPLAAQAAGYEQAVGDFRSRFKSPAFISARLSSQNQLTLQATDLYVSSGTTRQKQWVLEALMSWKESLRVAGVPNEAPMAAVVWKDGGDLWRLKDAQAWKMDDWSDSSLPFSAEQTERSGLFGFVGGQMVTGGAVDMTGFNARIGRTLFKDRYDLAATFGYASLDTSPKIKSKSYGLIGRALFPLTEHVGWNVGAELSRSDPSVGDKTTNLGLLGGLSFYLPSGSFDVTVSLGNHSLYGLLVGYTVFFSRK